MAILRCENLTKSFGINDVLINVSFVVEGNDHIGVFGNNGCGKSTLLKIIAGHMDYNSGNLIFASDISIGYLEQNTIITSENTLWEEMFNEYEDIKTIERQLKNIENKISELGLQGKINDRLFDEYEYLRTEYENRNGYAYESIIRKTLDGLGFSKNDYNRPIVEFSGGQKNKINLAKILQKKPDLLLLDEPTNYLDIPSCEWLEDYLKNYNGAVIVVSHDRYFLNSFVNKIFDIHHHTLDTYNGNYDTFIKLKEEKRKQLEKNYMIQQREINRLMNIISVQRNRGTEKSIKIASSREKMLKKIEKIEKPQEQSKMRLDLKLQFESSNIVVKSSNLSMYFDQNRIFENINFTIGKGEKIALIGPNGTGKSTLLKIIAGQLKQTGGEIIFGNRVQIGYLSQERTDLNFDNNLMEEIWSADSSLRQFEVRSILSYFLFTGDDVFKKVSTLSGGELIRLSLAKLVISKANFLLLDEPTNHLDIPSKEVIEDALKRYTGTILFVSHDRYFINKIANKIFELENGSITEYLGNYSYYIDKKHRLNNPEKETDTLSKTERSLMFKKQRESINERRELRQKLKEMEQMIEDTETEIRILEEKMGNPKIYQDENTAIETVKRYNLLKADLEDYYARWGELIESMEDF